MYKLGPLLFLHTFINTLSVQVQLHMQFKDMMFYDSTTLTLLLQYVESVEKSNQSTSRRLGLRNLNGMKWFKSLYHSDNARVFRDNFRVSQAVFDDLFAIIQPFISVEQVEDSFSFMNWG